MTDAAFITAQICTTAAAIAAGYFAMRAKQVASTTHDIVNHRMDEFMEMAKKSFTAEGVLKEKQDESVRQTDAKASRAEGAAEAVKAKPKD